MISNRLRERIIWWLIAVAYLTLTGMVPLINERIPNPSVMIIGGSAAIGGIGVAAFVALLRVPQHKRLYRIGFVLFATSIASGGIAAMAWAMFLVWLGAVLALLAAIQIIVGLAMMLHDVLSPAGTQKE